MQQDSSTRQLQKADAGSSRVPMRLLRSNIFLGCNIYHNTTVIRQRIDIGSLEGISSSAAGPEFATHFIERFAGLETMLAAGGITTELKQKLKEPAGVPLVELLFEAVLAIESSMAFRMHRLAPIEFAEKFPTGSPGCYDFVWQCASPKIGRGAMDAAIRGLTELLPAGLQPPNSRTGFAAALAKLKKAARRRKRSITSEVLSLAAARRGLPCESIGGAYLQLGNGIAQQVVHDSYRGPVDSAESEPADESTTVSRESIAVQLPLPDQWPASSIEEACLAADTFGYPVVLKPLKGKQTAGMRLCVQLPADVPAAFKRTLREGNGVVVEKFVSGQNHRLLVIGNKFVAGLHIMPPAITGDGIRTISELVGELNDDPIRNGVSQFKIQIGPELIQALQFAGHDLLDIPPADTEIKIDSVTEISKGATHTDVTDIIHPDNQQLAVNATEASGLSVAAINFVTADITRSYREVGGSIIAIDSRPGLYMHVWPRHGKSRDVGGEILKLLFPRGGNGRIPMIAVVGERGTARIARELDNLLQASGKAVGLALRNSSSICGEKLEHGGSRSRDAARFLLRDPRAEMVISARSTRAIAKQGLGVDRCDVAAILDPPADADIDAYCTGLETALKATRGTLVVNAGNRVALDRIRLINAQQVVLVSPSQRDTSVRHHLEEGRVAVTGIQRQGRGYIVVQRQQKIIASIPMASLLDVRGAPLSARAIQDRMFALALAYAAGLSSDELEADLHANPPLNLAP